VSSGDGGGGCILLPGGEFGPFLMRPVEPHVMWIIN
jgi:hypothetical protein